MTAKSYTEEEIREIAARQGLVGYPHLALMRESTQGECPQHAEDIPVSFQVESAISATLAFFRMGTCLIGIW